MKSSTAIPDDGLRSFWSRLKLALETLEESYEERLERRVNCLEIEVKRLSEGREQPLQRESPQEDKL